MGTAQAKSSASPLYYGQPQHADLSHSLPRPPHSPKDPQGPQHMLTSPSGSASRPHRSLLQSEAGGPSSDLQSLASDERVQQRLWYHHQLLCMAAPMSLTDHSKEEYCTQSI